MEWMFENSYITTTKPSFQLQKKVGRNSKNPPKLRFKKFVKLSGHTCFQQRFDKFWISSACNDRKRKLCEGHYSDSCTVLPGKSRENEMVKCLKIHISRLLSPSFQLQQKNDSILFLFPTMTWLKCRLGCKTINVKNFFCQNFIYQYQNRFNPFIIWHYFLCSWMVLLELKIGSLTWKLRALKS